eukprot:UN07530
MTTALPISNTTSHLQPQLGHMMNKHNTRIASLDRVITDGDKQETLSLLEHNNNFY